MGPLTFKTEDYSGGLPTLVSTTYSWMKWLVDHPEFLSIPLYVGGDSYSGMVIPEIVQQISRGNEHGVKPLINLQGYVLGNPVTDAGFDSNSKIPFAPGMGLTSVEL